MSLPRTFNVLFAKSYWTPEKLFAFFYIYFPVVSHSQYLFAAKNFSRNGNIFYYMTRGEFKLGVEEAKLENKKK